MTSENKGMPLLLGCAVVLFLTGLGSTALWGSEDRWAEIARIMILKKDFFHPCINGEIYFDKPLLSYWLIVLPALLTGTVNEFIVRLPSALAALAGLFATCHLARQLKGRGAALLAGWLLLTSLGFLFWARKGAADMENLAAIIIAVCWYCHCRNRAGFWSYLLFGLICVLGAHTKGLPAIAVPVVAVLPDLIRDGNWKKHLRWQTFAAVAVCIVVYLLPFVLASVIALPAGWEYPTAFDALRMPSWAEPYRRELCGLYLVWKENVLRFFEPFDHDDEPFYIYLIHVPRILLPWTLLFVFAFCRQLRNYRRLDPGARWMLEATILIFLLFSASGSRRWYYILPILPFCSIVTALYLCRTAGDRFTELLYQVHRVVVMVAGAVLTLTVPLYFGWRLILSGAARGTGKTMLKLAALREMTFPDWGLVALTLAGIVALLPWLFYRRRPERFDWILVETPLRQWAPLMLAVGALSLAFYGIFPTLLEPYRTEKDFALAVAARMEREKVGPERVAFYRKAFPKVTFYLRAEQPLALADKDIGKGKTDDEDSGLKVIPGTLLQQRPALQYFIVQNRYRDELAAQLPAGVRLTPVQEEKTWPWEKKPKKLSLYQISKGEVK